MKKCIIFLLSIISFFAFSFYVKAETFFEGEYLTGEYIKKKNNGVTYYMTMQFVRDSNGNIVYCLEPYTKFEEGKAYTEYVSDLDGYYSLSNELKRKISLIIYYGYGYGGRLDNKWYAITQFMIWKELIPEGDVYFTGSLNGRKVTRYVDEMNEIYNDINNHEMVPGYANGYEVDYGNDLYIPDFDLDNRIIYSDYTYSLDNGLLISSIKRDGYISFTKNSNYYANNVAIFDSNDSQDLIRPGNVINPEYQIDINVRKGNIKLDIRNDDSVYTVESDFSNTCYEILDSNDNRVDYVCTSNEGMIYNSVDLVYGEYLVRQDSFGIGYLKDNNSYKVIVDGNNTNPSLTLYNYLLKNKIELTKYACKNNQCSYEENAEFEVIDKNSKSVDLIKTNKLGQSDIVLGYGTYKVKQVKGLDNYSYVEDFTEKILDEETEHKRNLFNNYIEIEELVKKEVPVVEKNNNEEMVPCTKTDSHILEYLIVCVLILRKIIL